MMRSTEESTATWRNVGRSPRFKMFSECTGKDRDQVALRRPRYTTYTVGVPTRRPANTPLTSVTASPTA